MRCCLHDGCLWRTCYSARCWLLTINPLISHRVYQRKVQQMISSIAGIEGHRVFGVVRCHWFTARQVSNGVKVKYRLWRSVCFLSRGDCHCLDYSIWCQWFMCAIFIQHIGLYIIIIIIIMITIRLEIPIYKAIRYAHTLVHPYDWWFTWVCLDGCSVVHDLSYWPISSGVALSMSWLGFSCCTTFLPIVVAYILYGQSSIPIDGRVPSPCVAIRSQTIGLHGDRCCANGWQTAQTSKSQTRRTGTGDQPGGRINDLGWQMMGPSNHL